MKHALTRLVFEEKVVLRISSEQYGQIREATTGVVNALDVEEKFNLILENFEEFDGELLKGALDHSLFEIAGWSDRMTELHRVNRRLVNLLATCRLYIDQVPHNLSMLFGCPSNAIDQFRVATSREFDGRLGYRVMDAMRNYIQHRSLPIRGVVDQASWRDLQAGPLREHTLTPEVEPSRIRNDGEFRAATLKELEALGDRVDLTPLVREYVAALARIHRAVRDGLQPHAARWDNIISQARNDFSAAGGTDLVGLTAVALADDETVVEDNLISLDPTSRRRWLEDKNRYVEHYERVLVASRPVG